MKPTPDLIRLGSAYGGWIVPRSVLRPGAICYCVGAGTDITFDVALSRDFSCRVYCFDPTPAAIQHVAQEAAGLENFTFYPYGIWIEDTEMRFYAPQHSEHVSHSIKNLQGTEGFFVAECRSLPSVMEELDHAEIDLLKLDIEGAEYEVIGQLLERAALPKVLCVEFDQPMAIRTMLRLTRRLLRSRDLVAIDGWNYTFALRPF